jgi:hypothetical protein
MSHFLNSKKIHLHLILSFLPSVTMAIKCFKRSYEDTGSVVCLTTKGRQLERNFEELKPASHVPILGTILNIFKLILIKEE